MKLKEGSTTEYELSSDPTDEIIPVGTTVEGKTTFVNEDVENDFNTFFENCTEIGKLNSNWFSKLALPTVGPINENGSWNWKNISDAVSELETKSSYTISDVASKFGWTSTQMIGKTATVQVNGVDHNVRIIDAAHDVLSKTGNKAALTFEFANLISDCDGYSLASTWDGNGDTSENNYDFLNSNLFYNLEHLTPSTASTTKRTTVYNTGLNHGKGCWFRRYGATITSETQETGTAPTTDSRYAGKSVYDMLPVSLTSKIQEVEKTIATSSSYSLENYNCKLFLPTATEMNLSVNNPSYSTRAKTEGSKYSYYNESSKSTLWAKTIKQQVSDSTYTNNKSATTDYGTVSNCAGYNSSGYGKYWISSPSTEGGDGGWFSLDDGSLRYSSSTTYGYCYNVAYGLAPCFCI